MNLGTNNDSQSFNIYGTGVNPVTPNTQQTTGPLHMHGEIAEGFNREHQNRISKDGDGLTATAREIMPNTPKQTLQNRPLTQVQRPSLGKSI